MSKPRGIGVYLRAPSMYKGTTPEAYARAMGARWVAPVASKYSDAQLAELVRAGFRVWLFEHPSEWVPSKAAATLAALTARVRALGLSGVVVDTETAPQWASAGRAFALAFAASMAASPVPILWTTVPAWPYWREFAEATRGSKVYGSPQIYGVAASSSLRAADVRAQWLARWRAEWGAGRVVPSIAGWGRDELRQGEYFMTFEGEPSVAIWNTGQGVRPEVMGAQLAAAGIGRGGLGVPPLALGAGALVVLAALAAGGAT